PSMIPEMADYYKLTTGSQSRCFPLEISSTNNIRSVTWEFQIGNGETRPSSASIEQAFRGFQVDERHGKTIVTVPAANSSKLNATIYTDLRGKLWFVENPFFPIMLPEISVHFLITSIFSNIMRYRPDEWGSVLLNEVSSNISLLTRHYFSSFQRKFMLLVLRSSSRFIPYAL
ncbi:YaaC family protein, partial [Gluconobacter oxydans]